MLSLILLEKSGRLPISNADSKLLGFQVHPPPSRVTVICKGTELQIGAAPIVDTEARTSEADIGP